jgi:hypothetical protein
VAVKWNRNRPFGATTCRRGLSYRSRFSSLLDLGDVTRRSSTTL